MLIGIDPLLGPELLAILRAMGHGDEIVLADANFPASAYARRLVRLDGHGIDRVLDAVLSVMPLDDFEQAVFTMQVVGDADAQPEAVRAIGEVVAARAPAVALHSIERFAFYERAARAYAIVASGEARLYGNVILRKGVIACDPGSK